MELLFEAATALEKKLDRLLSQFDGMTFAQYRVLCVLDVLGDANMGQISDLLHSTRGNVTGIVDRLEEAGWLDRHRSKKDRRVVKVKLTKPIKKIKAAVAKALLENALPEAVQTYLTTLIQQLYGAA